MTGWFQGLRCRRSWFDRMFRIIVIILIVIIVVDPIGFHRCLMKMFLFVLFLLFLFVLGCGRGWCGQPLLPSSWCGGCGWVVVAVLLVRVGFGFASHIEALIDHDPILIQILALPMFGSMNEFSHIGTSITLDQGPLSMIETTLPGSFVHATRSKNEASMSMPFALNELSFVKIRIGINQGSLALSGIFEKGSLVLSSILPGIGPLAMTLSILKISFVGIAIPKG